MTRARWSAAISWAAASTSPSRSITPPSSRPSSGWGCSSRWFGFHGSRRSAEDNRGISTGSLRDLFRSPPERPTVLVVEDDPGLARLQRLRLERAGYSVVSAATAGEGLELLRRGGIDLVVLDQRLPGGD